MNAVHKDFPLSSHGPLEWYLELLGCKIVRGGQENNTLGMCSTDSIRMTDAKPAPTLHVSPECFLERECCGCVHLRKRELRRCHLRKREQPQ